MEKQLHLLTGSYALNSLTNGERSDFERHALTDPQTLEEVRSLSETAALLAYGTPEETPPPALKADVMAAIRNTRQLPASSVVRDISSARSSKAGSRGAATERRRWVPALSAAAALAIFAGVGVGGWVAGQNSSEQDIKEQLVASQAQQEAMLAIMSSPDAQIATTPLSDGGTVTVASSGKANKAAVMVNDMPPLPDGKTYELWFISAAGAVPAGLMDSPATPAMQLLSGEMGGATHVGITVEPAGGSEKPTTTPILVQEI
jgi:anti-sigma-K factor RskA